MSTLNTFCHGLLTINPEGNHETQNLAIHAEDDIEDMSVGKGPAVMCLHRLCTSTFYTIEAVMEGALGH
jgi:hypothetical protein